MQDDPVDADGRLLTPDPQETAVIDVERRTRQLVDLLLPAAALLARRRSDDAVTTARLQRAVDLARAALIRLPD